MITGAAVFIAVLVAVGMAILGTQVSTLSSAVQRTSAQNVCELGYIRTLSNALLQRASAGAAASQADAELAAAMGQPGISAEQERTAMASYAAAQVQAASARNRHPVPVSPC